MLRWGKRCAHQRGKGTARAAPQLGPSSRACIPLAGRSFRGGLQVHPFRALVSTDWSVMGVIRRCRLAPLRPPGFAAFLGLGLNYVSRGGGGTGCEALSPFVQPPQFPWAPCEGILPASPVPPQVDLGSLALLRLNILIFKMGTIMPPELQHGRCREGSVPPPASEF